MIEILGKLHPALVHMPIGFILMTVFYEWYRGTSSVTLWGVTTLSSLVAMGTGFILLKTGHYEGLNMFLHMIMGVVTTILCALLFIVKKKDISFFDSQNFLLKLALLIVLTIGGHMGAELTHGEEYLLLPFTTKSDSLVHFENHEKIVVYKDLIEPIFDEKCNRCHESGDARGRLNMKAEEGLLSDKFGDPAIKPGDLKNSEIFKRISLSPWHKKYMPPSGPDLTYAEKRLVEWWIVSGASFTDDIETMAPSEDIKALLLNEYNIDINPKSFYEKAVVDPLGATILSSIKEEGYNIYPLASNTNFVDVNIKGLSSEITADRINTLSKAKNQITWLDLSESDLKNDQMNIVTSLPNITKLKLQNTEITDDGLSNISKLKELTVLNLYGTDITDESIDDLLAISKLEKLYIWQTRISENGTNRLKEGNPSLEIVNGISQ